MAGESAHRHLQRKADEAAEWTEHLYAQGLESINVEIHVLAAQLIAMGEALEDHAWEAKYLEESRAHLNNIESAIKHINQRLD